MEKNQSLWQFIKFTLFSVSAGIIQVLGFALLHEVMGIEDYWLCHIPSLVLSVLWNFTFNRKYTFKSNANLPRSMALVALFYVVFTPASAWWGQVLQNKGVHAWLVEVMNLVINFVGEFLWQKFVVYRGSENTAK